jgi:predicted transcriptional regulator
VILFVNNSKKHKNPLLFIPIVTDMTMEIDEIKHIRKKLGLTQSELASHAKVSQSLIAKIEAGLLDPTYSNANKIFTALKELNKKTEAKASEIMNSKLIFVLPDEEIKEAVSKMKKFSVSQLPVIKDHKSVGIVSESDILDAILSGKGKKIKDIMADSPPVVSINTSISVVSDLLKFYSLILVSEDGELKGVITKSDLLAKAYN